MARKNNSGFVNRRLRSKRDLVRIYKTEEITTKKSVGSMFSCMTNISDTGTYEIEICEAQSPECASISTRPCSSGISIATNTSQVSKCENSSESRCSLGSFDPDKCAFAVKLPQLKTKNGLMQSYYPCFCVTNKQINSPSKTTVELVDKDTNTVVETVERGQSCEDLKSASSAPSLTGKEDKSKSPATTDSENNCSCSKCDSSSSSSYESSKSDNSSDESDSDCPKSNPSPDSSHSNGSNESCNSGKSLNHANEVPKDSAAKKPNEGKTTVVLELIREEDEKQPVNASQPPKTCNCVIKNYEDRLKKLESYHLSSGSTNDGKKATEKTEVDSRYRSCGCHTTNFHFEEIRLRIDELEKLYRDSLGKRHSPAEEKRESKELDPALVATEEEKGKGERWLLPENLDDATRTAIELAKIKKRLVDLEAKITNYKLHRNTSVRSFEKNSSSNKEGKLPAKPTNSRLNQSVNKKSDKEIQVMDFENYRERNSRTKDGWRHRNENQTAAYCLTKWDRMRFRDEAIQTRSGKEMDLRRTDKEVEMKKRRFRSKKSCDRTHLCKECDFYVTQKLGLVRSTSMEKLAANGSLHEENEKYSTEDFIKIKKSFGMNPINNLDYLPSKGQYNNRKSKRGRKSLKLRSKCPMTNLKESFDSDYDTVISYGEGCPWLISAKEFDRKSDCWSLGSRELKENAGNDRLPHQSLHIYHTREMRHSLLLQRPRDNKAEALHGRLHNPFVMSEKNSSDPATVATPNDSKSNNSTFIQNNRLNPFHHPKPRGKIKIPVLFEEVCNSGRGSSAGMVRVGVEGDKNGLKPWKKIFRKLSHSQSLDDRVELTPYGASSYHCETTARAKMEKSGERNKSFNLASVFKKSWMS